ncbi:MAG: hypothetical protein RQM90_04500 [Methanoculleus sp.]
MASSLYRDFVEQLMSGSRSGTRRSRIQKIGEGCRKRGARIDRAEIFYEGGEGGT